MDGINSNVGRDSSSLQPGMPGHGIENPAAAQTEKAAPVSRTREADSTSKASRVDEKASTAKTSATIQADRPALPLPVPGSQDPKRVQDAQDAMDLATLDILMNTYGLTGTSNIKTTEDLEKAMDKILVDAKAQLDVKYAGHELEVDPNVNNYAKHSMLSPEDAAAKIRAALGPLDDDTVALLLASISAQHTLSGGAIDINANPLFRDLRKNAMIELLSDKKFSPPITEAQKEAFEKSVEEYVEKFLSNPKTPPPPFFDNLTPSVKVALAEINTAVLAGIEVEVGKITSSPTYTGFIPGVTPVEDLSKQIESAEAGLDVVSDKVKAAESLLDGLPDSPGKSGLIDYLKIINAAIDEMRIVLAEISSKKAELSKDNTEMKMKVQEVTTKMQELLEASIAAKTKEKTKLQKTGQVFKRIGEELGKIAAIALAVVLLVVLNAAFPGGGTVLGAVILAATITLVAVSYSKTATDKLRGAAAWLMERVATFYVEKMGKEAGGVIAGILNTIIEGVFSGGNILMFCQNYTTQKGAIDSTCVATGAYGNPVDEVLRAKILMGVGITVNIIAIILITLATLGTGTASASAGAASTASATAATASTATTAAATVATTAERMQAALKVINMITTLISTASSITKSAIDIAIAKIDIKIIGKKEAAEILEEMIIFLKKLIEKLVESLNEGALEMPEMLHQLNTGQQANLNKLSQTIMNI